MSTFHISIGLFHVHPLKYIFKTYDEALTFVIFNLSKFRDLSVVIENKRDNELVHAWKILDQHSTIIKYFVLNDESIYDEHDYDNRDDSPYIEADDSNHLNKIYYVDILKLPQELQDDFTDLYELLLQYHQGKIEKPIWSLI